MRPEKETLGALMRRTERREVKAVYVHVSLGASLLDGLILTRKRKMSIKPCAAFKGMPESLSELRSRLQRAAARTSNTIV